MMRGLPGGSRLTALSQNVDRRALEAVEAEREAPRGEIVAGVDQVVLHRIGMEDARGPQVAGVADGGAELVRLDRAR